MAPAQNHAGTVVNVPAARWQSDDGSCGVARATEILAGKWTLAVIRALLAGPTRFTDVLRSIDGIAGKPLTETLRSMEERGLVVREYFAEVPPRVEYSLSARGESLLTVIAAMAHWGSQDLDVAAEEPPGPTGS